MGEGQVEALQRELKRSLSVVQTTLEAQQNQRDIGAVKQDMLDQPSAESYLAPRFPGKLINLQDIFEI